MLRVSVTKSFTFEAAHRLPGTYHGACRNLHGHSYGVEVTISGTTDNLDQHGMLLDFDDIKAECREWCQKYLDHRIIAWTDDPDVEYWRANSGYLVYEMDKPPTVENIAALLYGVFNENLRHLLRGTGVVLGRVKVIETASSWAEVSEQGV